MDAEHELMARYQRGDVAAFEALYRRHRAPLYRFLLRQVTREAVEDIFQETWLRVIKARHRYRPSGSFAAYLYQIARHTLVDHFRRSRRTREAATPDAGLHTACDDPTPAVVYEQDACRERLAAAIRALPAEQRDALLLRHEAGLGVGEIAALLGMPRETVKSRLRYATARLRSALARAPHAERRSA